MPSAFALFDFRVCEFWHEAIQNSKMTHLNVYCNSPVADEQPLIDASEAVPQSTLCVFSAFSAQQVRKILVFCKNVSRKGAKAQRSREKRE